MLETIGKLNYTIVLCDDIDRMKVFYRELLPFPVVAETATSLALDGGGVLLGLRQRERSYDGRGGGSESPGVQLAFLVAPDEVEPCYQQLLERGVGILDPPADQPRGHRTVYFSDPEGNVLEVYAEI
ncbi:MAG: glyoxalase [Planctomycetaceae bacterium]|nr:glyoxalase [Planctomycetaceae bacterium]